MNIGIIGAGQMGCGIAQVFASHNHNVILHDVNSDALALASKLNNVHTTSELREFKSCDLVIEAVIENLDIKSAIFKQVEEVVSKDCLIATNTSSISINALAAQLGNPARFLGLHFMNPATVMPLVEVIKGDDTSAQSVDVAMQLLASIEKQPVISTDSPGFIVNRLLIPMLNEGINILEEGVASVEDIDKALKLGANFPMGPLRLADFIGLDTCLAIMDVLQKDLKSDKYKPSALLKRYVSEGRLGKKSGRGFYEYKG